MAGTEYVIVANALNIKTKDRIWNWKKIFEKRRISIESYGGKPFAS